ESIRCQTFRDFEFIIVDDGSTDGSPGIIAEYARRDHRIRLIENKRNLGIVHALNRGLDACRGEYVARMDADDIALGDRFEKQTAKLESDPSILVLGGALSYMDKDGRELGVIRHCSLQQSLLAQNPLLHPTVMYRRQPLIRHGLRYLEKYRYAEDYFLWLQCCRLGHLDALDDVILKYRHSGDATRMKHLKRVLRATIKVKVHGIWRLKIKPDLRDVLRLFSECFLLFIPSPMVRFLYLRMTFGSKIMVVP
ncbi:MAG: glycosyltransferase, partial [Deltaproteobacteria bacterium]|nr:glycosyltransferase [Deltaproteobacteria bacterium]